MTIFWSPNTCILIIVPKWNQPCGPTYKEELSLLIKTDCCIHMDLIIAPFDLLIWFLAFSYPHFTATIPILYLEIEYLTVRKGNFFPVLLFVFLCIGKSFLFMCLSCVWFFYCFFAI